MGHKAREVACEAGVEGGQHGVRWKLRGAEFLVSQPRNHPALIGGTETPTTMHGLYDPLMGYLLRRGSAPWEGVLS